MFASSRDLVLIIHSLKLCMYLKPFGLPGSTIIITPPSLSRYQSASTMSWRACAVETSYST
jgi:hypothetical protein